MTLAHSALAPGLLIVSGFIGGFCVTNGSGKYLGLLPAHHAVSRAPHANEDAAAGIMAAADGQTSQGGRKHAAGGGGGGEAGDAAGADAAGAETGGADQSGADQGGASGDGAEAAAAMNGGGGGGTIHGADAATPRLVTGVEAGAILAGNTVVADAARQRYVYFAPRGLRIEGNRNGFTARLWDRDKATLCGPGGDGVLVCHIVEVRSSAPQGQPPTGTPLGDVRMDGERWLPILSGNVQSFPGHLPFLDSVVAEPKPDRAVFKATATGKAAWAALLDHPAAIAPPVPGQTGRIITFAKDGGVIDIERPQDDVDDATVLKGSMGTWTFAKTLLCKNGAGPDAVSACFTIEARGKTSFRLAPKDKGEAMRLDLLAESPPRQRQAAQ